jgi:hypothetical protein
MSLKKILTMLEVRKNTEMKKMKMKRMKWEAEDKLDAIINKIISSPD